MIAARRKRLIDDIQEILLGHAARDPNARFLLADGRDPMTYRAMAAQVEHVRERFAAWGIARGDVVASTLVDRATSCLVLASAPVASAIALLSPALGVDACAELIERVRVRAVLVPAWSSGRYSRLAATAGACSKRATSVR
jgi:hypothetical protein